MKKKVAKQLFFIFVMSLSKQAFPYEYAHESSVGLNALRTPKAALFSRADMSWVNGLIVSSPKSTKRYDQRAITSMGFGFNAGLSSFVLRFQARGFATRKAEFDLSIPKQTTTSVRFQTVTTSDVAYQSDNNEFVGGVILKTISKTKSTSSSSTYESTTTEPAEILYAPRVAYVRRTGDWDAGFSYSAGTIKQREFETSVSDGSTQTTTDVVSLIPEIAVFACFRQSIFRYDLEVALVQASNSGVKSSSGANYAEKDYFRLYGSALWRPSNTGVRAAIIYKTISYSDQAYMTLDNISQMTAELFGEFGSANAYVFLGGAFTSGKDTQNITELKAEYSLQAYAFKTGFVTLF